MTETDRSTTLNKLASVLLIITGVVSLLGGCLIIFAGISKQGAPEDTSEFLMYIFSSILIIVSIPSIYSSVSYFRGKSSAGKISYSSIFQGLALLMPCIAILLSSEHSPANTSAVVILYSVFAAGLLLIISGFFILSSTQSVDSESDSLGVVKSVLTNGWSVTALLAVVIITGYFEFGFFGIGAGTSTNGPSCGDISGVYEGFYKTKLDDRGLAQITIQPNCEYEFIEDVDGDGDFSDFSGKNVWTSGTIEEKSGEEYTLENGATITVRGSTVRYSGGQANATMQWKKDVR